MQRRRGTSGRGLAWKDASLRVDGAATSTAWLTYSVPLPASRTTRRRVYEGKATPEAWQQHTVRTRTGAWRRPGSPPHRSNNHAAYEYLQESIFPRVSCSSTALGLCVSHIRPNILIRWQRPLGAICLMPRESSFESAASEASTTWRSDWLSTMEELESCLVDDSLLA